MSDDTINGYDPCADDRVVSVLGGGAAAWDGWTATGAGWALSDRSRVGDPEPASVHWESGEASTGSLISPVFRLAGEKLNLWVAGWNGSDGISGDSGYLLRLADDGRIVRDSAPPQQDAYTRIEWYVRDLKGRDVYIEVRDGVSAVGCGWLALARVEEIALRAPESRADYHCLDIPAAPGGVWAILGDESSGGRHLSSFGEGGGGTGAILSPSFTLSSPAIRLVIRGWCDQFAYSRNRVELVDVDTSDVLRTAYPPLSDEPRMETWQVDDLNGRRVRIRLVQSEAASSRAWLGLDEIDAGSDFHADFAGGDDLEGWEAPTRLAQPTELFGVPFIVHPGSVVRKGSTAAVEIGVAARRILLAGMKPSEERLFVGDRLGCARVVYGDGSVDVYPLTIGESLWWGGEFRKYPEPFVSFPEARRALESSLRLYPAQPTARGDYIACVDPRPMPIASVEFVSDGEAAGSPVILGATVVPLREGDSPANSTPMGNGWIPDGLHAFLDAHPLRREDEDRSEADARITALREVMYCTEGNFPDEFPLDMPSEYVGPIATFRGDKYADFFTNVFHHNVVDLTKKVDGEGVYHTSSAGAPWYGYDGVGGTYSMEGILHPGQKPGIYYAEAWTRDLGRSLEELISFGFTESAARCADWCLEMARVWETGEGEHLKLNGHRLPRHVHRIFQFPSTGVGAGCFENDGHGLTSMFIHNLWRRIPERDRWTRERWDDVKGLGDWVVWQFDHPEISKATEVLWCDSEASGWPFRVGPSFYCDLTCIEALNGLAEMAESIGETGSAETWRATADRMKSSCERFYVDDDPTYGTTWSDRYHGWDKQSLLGPTILPCDRNGLCADGTYPEWRAYNEAAYERNKTTFWVAAMGYCSGFTTQAALLLDRLGDAARHMETNARAIYGPVYEPYIVPESGVLAPDRKTYTRSGDLGNGVQQAEILKALRIVIGIDDRRRSELGIIPRLPTGWTGVSVREYPILIDDGARREVTRLNMEYSIECGSATLSVESAASMPAVRVRVGPFERSREDRTVRVDGGLVDSTELRSGDSWWTEFRVSSGRTSFSAEVG